jgi:hypothetical protein
VGVPVPDDLLTCATLNKEVKRDDKNIRRWRGRMRKSQARKTDKERSLRVRIDDILSRVLIMTHSQNIPFST